VFVCVDVPETFSGQDSEEVSDADEQPQSGSDTEDEIKRLSLLYMLLLISWPF
jgi:hypothetical protein